MANEPSRVYPAHPLIGVSCAVWDGTHVLLIKRGRPPYEGAWSLPGGLVALGETLAEAAAREVKEETGLSVEITGRADLIESLIPDETGVIKRHFVIHVHAARYGGGQTIAGDDAADARWFAEEALDHLPQTPDMAFHARKAKMILDT